MENQKILLWGTYDLGKPRVRIMRAALLGSPHLDVQEIHTDLWAGVEDKSQLGYGGWLAWVWHMLCAYPSLLRQLLSAPKDATVVVGYMGLCDVLLLWPFARLRGHRIVWDMFLSLHDTVVNDRKILRRYNPLAMLLYAAEYVACRAADSVVLDTQAHAQSVAQAYRLCASKLAAVPVGVEAEFFPPAPPHSKRAEFVVLFYGQCIPLHGMHTIVQAAQLNTRSAIRWRLIGAGQQAASVRNQLQEHPIDALEWRPWLPYEQLHEAIHGADICLGIFGDSDKAANVVPNKVFQALACGKRVITREAGAIDELSHAMRERIVAVPPADAVALLAAIHAAMDARDSSIVPLVQDVSGDWLSALQG